MASPTTSTQDYHANPETPLSTGDAVRRDMMHELFGSSAESENSMEHEVMNEDDGDSYELSNQIEEDGDENMEDEEDLFGADKHACEELMKNGPQSGLEFESRERIFATYQAFAKVKGFSIITRTARSDKYLLLSCGRARKPNAKKYTKKINCPTRLNAIKQDNGNWKISTFCNEHNHDLEPQLSEFMPAHRHLTTHLKVLLEAYDRAGSRLCKSVRTMEVLAGGPSNLGASTRDCRNHVDKMRRLRLGDGDANAIQKMFKRLQQNDRDFFYLIDIGDDSRLRHVMWIHPRSRAAYQDFHDVVSFDTTYLVNQYNMPFGTVVGVNHHHHSILLGCCLLSDERAESFKWFFSNWLDAMGGVQPTAILSDQVESITIALREVLPDSIHRFCLWHIVSKSSKKFRGIANFEMACLDFNRVIHGSFSIPEFENNWLDFQVKYNLHENSWIKNLYEIRQSWVPVYSKHIFWAGMMSTQRSESMHAFFDNYINSRSTLKIFVEQYEICIVDKIRKELQAEYSTKCRPITCVSEFKWESQFAKVYTNNIMELLQKQVKKIWNCNLILLESDSSSMDRYDITETRTSSKYPSPNELHFMVEHRPVGGYFDCNCKKFENKGIFCCHILKVLVFKKLIMSAKDIFYGDGGRINLAIDSEEKISFVKDKFKEIQRDLKRWKPAGTISLRSQNTSEAIEIDAGNIPILDPVVVTRKGRPRTARFKDPAENRKGRGRGRGRGRSGVRGPSVS
ncbi:protein FAR-RED IMPAIRED RESPONSE 1-like [Salvia splendens]|uniref:protein FAR-RED IMPAIRED RESPONSE 1-like n=1 Tax=Salvia splendens TaxID=180675 RepID=UPI001C26EBA6|nr:protein FAR-RED IMPAIRED RESPONSE 1-like [Salvia splendens]